MTPSAIPSLRSSLKWRLVVIIGLLAFTTTLLLSQIVSHNVRHQIETDKGSLLREMAVQMASRLDQDMNTRAQEILFLTHLQPILSTATPAEHKQALLEQVKAAYPHYAWIGMTDDRGNILVGTDGLLVGKNVAKRAWFIEGSKGLHFGNAHDAFLLAKLMPKPKWDDLPLRLVDVSAPIRDSEGRLIGVICGHLSLDWAFEVRERMLAGETAASLELIVLNPDGQVLMGTPALPSLSADLGDLKAVAKALAAGAAVRVEPWADGIEYLTAAVLAPGFRDFPGMGWLVVARESERTAFAPARHLGAEVLGLGVLFALLFGLLLWWILTRQLRPLERVSAAAARLRGGDLSAQIPRIGGGDEISLFARSLTDLVHDLQEANAELRLTSRVFEESNQGIIISDAENRIIRINSAFSQITGYSQEEALGRNPALLSSGVQDPNFYRAMWKSLQEQGIWRGEIWNRNKAGKIYPEALNINTLRGPDGGVTHYIGLFDDISEKKEYERKLLHLANYDPLTDLPNRHLLHDKIAETIERAQTDNSRVAVLFADLDQFKKINDTLGHPAGDRILIEVARRFFVISDADQTIARWGGDEFVAVLPLGEGDTAATQARKLLECLRAPFYLHSEPYRIGASIGIALYPQDSRDADGLLRCADTAMYEAKRAGKNRFAYFDATANARIEQFLRIERGLHNAIANNEMQLLFQPQFDIEATRIVGAEVLLRWNHPELSGIGPDIFIQVAEQSGQIRELGGWVIEQSLVSLAAMGAAGFSDLPLSVNLSMYQLMDRGLPERLSELTARHGVKPDRFKIEVTESAIMSDETTASEVLTHLRGAGFPISIDDFGTGYSCLTYINQIKPCELKVDKSFVQNISSNPDCHKIVDFTIRLADTMEIEVVAEGVENDEQLSLLRQMGSPRIQGFLLGRPLPLHDFLGLLASGQ